MYRKCVTEISARHQRQVTDSLSELMQKMPFADISVTHLCQHAGVSRRVYYHLFSNKTDALYALVDQKILDMESYCPEIGDPYLRFFLYWAEDAQKDLLHALEKNQLNGLLLERLMVNIMNEAYDIRYWLKSNGWVHEKEIIIFMVTGVMGLIYGWHYCKYDRTPEEMAALLEKLLNKPLAGTNA